MGERRGIVIAGAGIGGLTAALALAQAGFRVTIAERNTELSEVGAGIQLSPNAGRVLAALGLDAAIAAAAVEPAAIDVRSAADGRLITSLPTARFRERYGFPYRSIHRGDLQRVLAEAVGANPAITLRLGATVGEFAQHAGSWLVRVEHGGAREVVGAAAIIGADGIWSEMRSRIPDHATPRASGRTAWRGMVALDNAPPHLPRDRVGLWLGRDAHLVHYPVSAGSAINIVAIVEEPWDRQGWSAPGDKRVLLARFARWCEAAQAIIKAPFGWQKWTLATLYATGPWTHGPVALLGDAAHGMLPFIAQGAAMAIEDAAVLARSLAAAKSAEAGLAAYEAARKPRVSEVAEAARATGETYHWGPPLATARDLTLRALGPRLILGRNDWIYRWRV
jgi:salicylate hydroxylase